MKTKLPIIVGGIYLLLSLPFIFGYLQPSLHEGGYSAIYVFLNLPGLLVISGLAKKIETILITDTNLTTSNIIALTLLLLFWTAIAFIVGALFDAIQKKENHGRLNKPIEADRE